MKLETEVDRSGQKWSKTIIHPLHVNGLRTFDVIKDSNGKMSKQCFKFRHRNTIYVLTLTDLDLADMNLKSTLDVG